MKKILIASILIIFNLIILPLLTYLLKPIDVMGYSILLMFIINPITSIILGIITSLEIKKLWFIPIVYVILFPITFMIITMDFTLDLYIYSGIYLIIFIITILISSFIKKQLK